jgi:hypothetical protein
MSCHKGSEEAWTCGTFHWLTCRSQIRALLSVRFCSNTTLMLPSYVLSIKAALWRLLATHLSQMHN